MDRPEIRRPLLPLRLSVNLTAIAIGACSDDPLPSATKSADAGADAPLTSVCPTGYLGDPSLEAVVELRALRADGTDVPLASGDDLAIVGP